MTITTRPRWSLGHGKPLVPSSWQATNGAMPVLGSHRPIRCARCTS